MGPRSKTSATPIQFGKYQLVERLGHGGMAEVWRAKILGPAGFERTVVVKRILPHRVDDAAHLAMFEREARLSARLNHSNIVQVFELGRVEDEYFLAMEYVEGHNLADLLRRHGELGELPSPGFAAYATREVARALAYAHALADDNGQPLRIVHRDVSPSNVMLAVDGAVKLLDFGVAKALDDPGEQSQTRTGELKGKFGYMSPELLDGHAIDHRVDLWATGVMLHELCTGRRLFRGATEVMTIDLVRAGVVPPPSSVNPAVPPELDRICLRALARRIEDRYQRAEELAHDLDRVVRELGWGPARAADLACELFPTVIAVEDALATTAVPNPAAPPAREAKGDATPKAQAPRGPRRSWARRLWPLAPLALVVGAVLVARRAQLASRTVPPPAPVLPATVGGPPPTTTPASVSIDVRSTPDGAEVFVDDEAAPRGQTPLLLTLPRGREKHRVRIRKRSYQEYATEVVADRDARLDLSLTPSWAVPFSPKPTRPARSPRD
jgi:tRNA A-37 threonylcarbamoyl transferase component Bud32